MSAQRIQVDVSTLLQQLRALEDYIATLQANIERVNAVLSTLYAGERALEELKNGDLEALVDLDGGGIVYGRAKLSGGEAKVLVHAGLDIFVELPIDKAISVIRERQAETSKLLDAYRRELANAVSLYQQLLAVLQQAGRQQAIRGEQRQGS